MLFIDRRGVDDPVGAVAVHGVNGVWGLIALGLFANGKYGGDWNATAASGGTKTAHVADRVSRGRSVSRLAA